MKFKRIDQEPGDTSVRADSMDNLECFGEYSKGDAVCTRYCAMAIRCAVEHDQNPRIDLLDHLLTLDFFPAKIH
jgi:hypothetical protein